MSDVFFGELGIPAPDCGCPYALMVEPTDRMLSQFDLYGAKPTILADVAEMLKFKEYAKTREQDDYHYAAMVDQLRDVIRHSQDVKLHIHPLISTRSRSRAAGCRIGRNTMLPD